jgi:hypothetical protein
LWGLSNSANLLSLGVIQYNVLCNSWNGETVPEAPAVVEVSKIPVVVVFPEVNTTTAKSNSAKNDTMVPVLNVTTIAEPEMRQSIPTKIGENAKQIQNFLNTTVANASNSQDREEILRSELSFAYKSVIDSNVEISRLNEENRKDEIEIVKLKETKE